MRNSDLTVREAAVLLTQGRQAREKLLLSFDSVVVSVLSNNSRLIDGLSRYFKGFTLESVVPADIEIIAVDGPEVRFDGEFIIKEPDPGKTKIKEEFIDLADGRMVRKRLTGMIFLFGNGLNLAVGPCLENDNQVVNFINNRLIQWGLDRNSLLAHAAAVNLNDKGLALAGFSGMGKSTLALHLMSRGLNFVSNDRLLIKESTGVIEMRGVPKLPRINPGTALNNPDLVSVIPEDEREVFGKMSEDDIWTLEHKYDVDIAKCFGPGRFKLSSPLNALGILNWHRNAGPAIIQQVNLDKRRDLLGAVRKSPGLFYLPGVRNPDQSEEAYIERLGNVAVYEISGGVDFQKAASDCQAALEKL